MISLGGLVSQKAFGKFEMGKVISNPFANAFVNEGVDMDKLEFELKHLKKNNPGKKVEYHFIKSSEYPNGYYFTVNKKIIKNIFKNEAEGSEDHEVSMANNSIDTIIKMATELKAKMGEDEKQIPAWIQDHIAKAENYISQASGNYHEYGDSNESVNEAPKKLKHTISKKEWSKIPKYNKHIGMDGVHYIMKYDDKIGTYLQGVQIVDESVNEASVSKLHKDHTKVVEMIQHHLEKYKSSKGTPQAEKHVSELKKLNAVKKKIEADLDSAISGLYKDAELKQD
jgi:ribosomal protein L22